MVVSAKDHSTLPEPATLNMSLENQDDHNVNSDQHSHQNKDENIKMVIENQASNRDSTIHVLDDDNITVTKIPSLVQSEESYVWMGLTESPNATLNNVLTHKVVMSLVIKIVGEANIQGCRSLS